jgi:hypothetical protein
MRVKGSSRVTPEHAELRGKAGEFGTEQGAAPRHISQQGARVDPTESCTGPQPGPTAATETVFAYQFDDGWAILRTMSSVPMDIPEATLVALKLDPANAAVQLRMAAAMKLFELGRLSSGAAAELAGVSRIAFLARLNEFGVESFRQSEADLANDLVNA